MHTISITNCLKVCLAYLLLLSNLSAENLSNIYEMALANDPLLKSAEASFRAGKESRIQGVAGLLPSVRISGSTNWNEYRIEDQLVDEYNSSNYSGSLTQPIFRLDKWFQFRKGKAMSESAAAEFAHQQQKTMIRVATGYFRVLNAVDSLSAAKAEEEAIGKQKDQAKRKFDVGLAPITELHETQAAYDLTVVSRIALEGQLDTAKEALGAIIGGEVPLLSPLSTDYPITLPDPIERETWVKLALVNNYQLRATRLNQKAAKNNARASGSAHLPNIDIVGRVSKNTSKQGKFGGFIQNPLFGLEQDSRQYGIQVTMPIFAGGAISSARRQAYALYDQSKEQTLYRERITISETRSNHFNVQTQAANVNARKQALTSAKSALEATKIGYDIGSRNIVDLLQAERGLYAAERDFLSARYEYIIAMLNLKSSVGSLSPDDLVKISNWMN